MTDNSKLSKLVEIMLDFRESSSDCNIRKILWHAIIEIVKTNRFLKIKDYEVATVEDESLILAIQKITSG